MDVGGPLRFARYGYPPNELGYCGPAESQQILEQTDAGVADADLRRLLGRFDGAWPYLELIAHANGIADPLDARVVEAYWIGNELLDAVDVRLMGDSIEDRFRPRAGREWGHLAGSAPAGAKPHHAFHVFGVYPWLGMLREGRTLEPLHVLDRCRIRWGQVVSVAAGQAVVRSRPLTWDGRRLSLAEPVEEQVTVSLDGHALAHGLAPGSWCSLHWDWVCEPLDARQLSQLTRRTAEQLDVVNRLPAPAAVLG
jgi:hypothetical protein